MFQKLYMQDLASKYNDKYLQSLNDKFHQLSQQQRMARTNCKPKRNAMKPMCTQNTP